MLAALIAFQFTRFLNVAMAPLSFGLSFLSPEVWGKGFTKSIEWIDEALALMMFIPLAYGAFIAVSLFLYVVFNTVGVPFFTRLANSGPDWVLSLAESQYTDIAQRARGQLAWARQAVTELLSSRVSWLLYFGNLQKSQAFDAVNQLNEMEDVTAPLPAWDHFAQMWLGWAKRDGASIVPQKVKAEAAIEAIVGQRCVDLNALGGNDKCTLLHYLVRPGSRDTLAARLRCASFLIRHSARIVADAEGNTPLHVAARSGDATAAFLEVLLKAKGANVNATNKFGSTPLHLAAAAGSVHALDLLLRHEGANVNVAHGLDGSAPLHWAARAGHINAVRVLIDDFAASVHRVNKSGSTALHLSVRGGHMACVRKLVTAESDVHAELWDGRTPHDLALSKDIRKLLGTAPPKLSLSPTALAAMRAKEASGRALQTAARKSGVVEPSSPAAGCLDTIISLLKQGAPAEPDRDGRSPLHFAVLGCPPTSDNNPEGRVQAIRALLEGSVDIMIDAKSDGDATALHWAAQFGHTACVKALLESGADVGAVTTAGDTPLHLAANAGCATALLSHKADPERKNKKKQTPEHSSLSGSGLQGDLKAAKQVIIAKLREMEKTTAAASSDSGLQLSRIVSFVKEAKLDTKEASEGPYSSWRFGQDIVKDSTNEGKGAFVDDDQLCSSHFLGPAAVFVCHAHKNRFQVLVETLGNHFSKEKVEPYLWVDLFCMSQHTQEHRLNPNLCAKLIKDGPAMQKMVVVMDPWKEPHVLSRLWCLWEIANAEKAQRKIEFVLSEAERKSFVAALWDEVDPNLSGGIQKVLSHIRGLDARNAEAWSAQDEVLIKKQIETSLGGYETLNATVSRSFRGLLEKYAEQELIDLRARPATLAANTGRTALADFLNVLGNMYYDHGKLCAAQGQYTEALEIREQLLEEAKMTQLPPAGHAAVVKTLVEKRLTAMNNLANILKDNLLSTDDGTAKKSPAERKEALQRARELYEEVLEARELTAMKSIEHIRSVHNLGALLAMPEVVGNTTTDDGKKRLADARQQLENALEWRLDHPDLGPEHKDTLMSQEGLAVLLCDWAGEDQAQLRAGVQMWRSLITGRVRCPAIGDRHRRTFVARAGLGKALMRLGEIEEASSLLQAAVDGLKEIGAVPLTDPDLRDAASALRMSITGGDRRGGGGED